MFPKVAVIVLCFNGVDLTVGCLDSLLRQNYPNMEVVIVDNCSTDGTIPTIAEKFPQVKAPIFSTVLSPTTLYYMSRNRFLFFYRHAQGPLKLIALARALKGILRGIRENWVAGKFMHSKAMRYAVLHALTGHWGYANQDLWMSAN